MFHVPDEDFDLVVENLRMTVSDSKASESKMVQSSLKGKARLGLNFTENRKVLMPSRSRGWIKFGKKNPKMWIRRFSFW